MLASGVLNAAIGVVEQSGGGMPVGQRHAQRGQHGGEVATSSLGRLSR